MARRLLKADFFRRTYTGYVRGFRLLCEFALAVLFCAVFPVFASEEGADGEEAFRFHGVVSEDGIYTRSDSGMLVISGADRLLVEDYDEFMRPVSRTEWTGGERTRSVVWVYPGENLYPYEKTESSADAVVKSVYDAQGRETARTVFDADGALSQKVLTEYENGSDEKVFSVVTENFSDEDGEGYSLSSSEKVVFAYGADGAVAEKQYFLNGILQKIIQYESTVDWTETVYYDGEAVFTDRYADGVRVTGR